MQKRLLIPFLLATVSSLSAADSYERMSSVRIVEEQASYQAMMEHRHNKRVIAGVSISTITVAGVAWLVYLWNKPAEPIDTTNELPPEAFTKLQVEAMQDFMQVQREMRTAKGLLRMKFTEGIALGLAGAFVSFVLAKSSSALNNTQPLIERIIPLSDIPLLVDALHHALTISSHYDRTMRLLLEHQTKNGSFAHGILEKNKRLEHKQLIMALERLAACTNCFTDDLGDIVNQQIQVLIGQLIDITNQLATDYELPEGAAQETHQLVKTVRIQCEHIGSLILPILEELGYAQA